MLPADDFERVTLVDGSHVDVAVTARDGIVISRSGSGDRNITLPYPLAGFGGGGLLLSPSGRFLVVHYFSGQSEATFCLIDIANGFALVAAPDYFRGEAASFVFDSDEKRLFMAMPYSCGSPWWEVWDDDGLELDEDDHAYIPYGMVVRCDTSTGKVDHFELQIVPSVDAPLDRAEHEPFLLPDGSGPRSGLVLRMPWGSVQVHPPNDSSAIRLPYPAVDS